MRNVCFMILFLTVLCSSALASENLAGSVLIPEEGIVYTGLDEDGLPGVYASRGEYSLAKKLYDGAAYLLAASDQYILANIQNDEGEYASTIIDREGKIVFSGDFSASNAIYADGMFFAGRFLISAEGGLISSRELLGEFMYPVAYADGWLYYYDGSKYASVSAMEDVKDVCAVYRLNIATGENDAVTREGARLISVGAEELVYSLNDFYITENGDTKTINVDSGIYKSGLDGENAAKLCGVAGRGSGVYEEYGAVSDGVVYGISYNYETDDPVPAMVLKRVSPGGAPLGDVSVDFGTLAGVENGRAFICACVYNDEYEYVSDDIVSFDLQTGERTSLLSENRFTMRFFDTAPRIAVTNGAIYFVAYDRFDGYFRLWSVNTDGSGLTEIAKLFYAV